MNDSYAGEVVILVMSFFAMVVPFGFFIWTGTWAAKGLGQLGKAMQNGMQNAARRTGQLGKKAAMNSKYGQAAQQFMGQRKAISQLKGKEALRSTLNRNPGLAKLMGGVGGQQYASRFLNQENRRHEAEQIQELSKNMSLPMANAIAKKQNLSQATAGRNWLDEHGRDTGKQVTAEDRAGIRQLQEQGYLDSGGRIAAGRPHSAIAASAALQEIYNSDDVTAEKVAGLGSLLKGMPGESGVEANSNFTKLNRDLAVKGKNKNVAFASFNNGEINQFHGKKPEGIIASGLQGMNKDALKPSNHDLDANGVDSGENALLAELDRAVHGGTRARDGGTRDLRAVVERTRQTMDQNHQEVLQGLADSMGFANVDEFKELRNALNSGGGVDALPVQFRAVMGGSAQPVQPVVVPQQPTLVVPHTPPPTPPRPRQSNFPPTQPPTPPPTP
ncbi:MAG TPA: hypothetical protein VJM32_05130 [Candidatus Saccharimonadales bacterium]|nr:hypothetical protein [Candidatus Saccharimonadales bacterium]